MRRSPRVVLAWVAAALVALATVRVVAGDLSTLHARARALGRDVSVVVAVHDLPLGSALGAGDVRVVARPLSLVPPDALHDVHDAIGKVVGFARRRDDVVRRADVTRNVVRNGTRAVHLLLKDGFRPPVGAVVDVLAAFGSAGTGGGATFGTASVVARGAQVLSVDDTGSGAGSAITLLVAAADAPAIAGAAAGGEVSVALAPPESAVR